MSPEVSTGMNVDGIDVAVEDALRRAAARATLAPSIHNSQPWHFVVGASSIDVRADPERRVPVIDPAGRQGAISCGAAIFALRVALAAERLDVVTVVPANPDDPDLLATVTVVGRPAEIDLGARRLDDAADERRSNRRQFDADAVPAAVVDRLVYAAELEGAWLQPVHGEADRVLVAVASQHADTLQNGNPAYRAELRAWTTDDPTRPDGVPAAAIPHTTSPARDDVPIRDFDTRVASQLAAQTPSSLNQTMLVLGTAGDRPPDWLAAGQALERVLLELTSAGYVASMFSQVAEEPSTRQQLRDGLRLSGHPHLVLRVGHALLTPATPRRPNSEVITVGA